MKIFDFKDMVANVSFGYFFIAIFATALTYLGLINFVNIAIVLSWVAYAAIEMYQMSKLTKEQKKKYMPRAGLDIFYRVIGNLIFTLTTIQ